MAWTLTTKFVHPADWGASVGSTPVRHVRFQVMGSSSDTTELAAQSILALTSLKGPNGVAATAVSIESIQYSLAGVTYLDLLWDHTTDEKALRMAPGTNIEVYDPPLRSTSTGDTGALVLTSSGASATGAFTLDIQVLVHS
jgi:hypothetical protein